MRTQQFEGDSVSITVKLPQDTSEVRHYQEKVWEECKQVSYVKYMGREESDNGLIHVFRVISRRDLTAVATSNLTSEIIQNTMSPYNRESEPEQPWNTNVLSTKTNKDEDFVVAKVEFEKRGNTTGNW